MASTTELNVGSARFSIAALANRGPARQLRALVDRALDEGDRHVVFDCSEWSQMEVKTLSSLIQGAAACSERGARFEVANLSMDLQKHVRDLHLAGRLGLS
jgi:hypothetical protein